MEFLSFYNFYLFIFFTKNIGSSNCLDFFFFFFVFSFRNQRFQLVDNGGKFFEISEKYLKNSNKTHFRCVRSRSFTSIGSHKNSTGSAETSRLQRRNCIFLHRSQRRRKPNSQLIFKSRETVYTYLNCIRSFPRRLAKLSTRHE